MNELVAYPQMVSGVIIDVSNIYKRADPWVCSGRDMQIRFKKRETQQDRTHHTAPRGSTVHQSCLLAPERT